MHTPFGSLRHVAAIINHGLFFNFQTVGCAGQDLGLLAESNKKNGLPFHGHSGRNTTAKFVASAGDGGPTVIHHHISCRTHIPEEKKQTQILISNS